MLIRSFLIVLVVAVHVSGHSDPYTQWKELSNEWGHGENHEHKGLVCDSNDMTQGCVLLYVAEPSDSFTVKDLPLTSQDNFQNTQHYKAAWTLHGEGFLGSSLPRAPQDISPTCYIANVSGTIVMGYEEGRGDVLLPCPGADRAVPFTEEEILAEDADHEEMCNQCYFAVCSGRGARAPYSCGSSVQGGVDVGSPDAALVEQASAAYHCHLTMSNQCDELEHDLHEVEEGYGMDYGVYCGWDKVRELNVSFCDCQLEGTRWRGRCNQNECVSMAYEGVACGNCRGCDHRRAYEAIFNPASESNSHEGACAGVRTAKDEAGRNHSMMLCSKAILCRDGDSWHAGCDEHCLDFGPDSDIWVDDRCAANLPSRRSSSQAEPQAGEGEASERAEEDGASPLVEAVSKGMASLRRLLAAASPDASLPAATPAIDLHTPIDRSALSPDYALVMANRFKHHRDSP